MVVNSLHLGLVYFSHMRSAYLSYVVRTVAHCLIGLGIVSVSVFNMVSITYLLMINVSVSHTVISQLIAVDWKVSGSSPSVDLSTNVSRDASRQ